MPPIPPEGRAGPSAPIASRSSPLTASQTPRSGPAWLKKDPCHPETGVEISLSKKCFIIHN